MTRKQNQEETVVRNKNPTRPRLWSRRRALKTALGVAAALAPAALAAPALAAARRKVTIVYGVQTIDSPADDFFAAIPLGLGLYAEEGLDVRVETVAGAGAAVNLLLSGQAQFATHGTAGLLDAVDKGAPIQGFTCEIPGFIESIAVATDGPIKSFDDLKGKTIGVSANAGAPVFMVKAVMRERGWNPDTDASLLAVGTGLPALDALRRGRVQALVEWDTIYGLFEFYGAKFLYLRPPPIPTLGFAHTTNTTNTLIAKDPALAVSLARAIAKAIVYMAAAPPDELSNLHYKVFPASRPAGLTEAQTYQLNALRLHARTAFMGLQARVFDRTVKIGDVSDSKILAFRSLLYGGGEIRHQYPADRYFTRQFLAASNDFDIPALIAKAQALRV